MSIGVIDLFAGPGGLGEGFATFRTEESDNPFKTALSIEKDKYSSRTLYLRTLYRQFAINNIPDEYYQLLRNKISLEELKERYPEESNTASTKVWNCTLGEVPEKRIDDRIRKSLKPFDDWILIGGPPCQAYSLAGRSRNGGINPNDKRVYLYREYYRILAVHNPKVFIMENVKGLLSATVRNNLIIHQILNDLRNPVEAYKKLKGLDDLELKNPGYNIYSLVNPVKNFDNDGPVFDRGDFIIESEKYGIPQKRHRIILLGIRKDLKNKDPDVLSPIKDEVPIRNVLYGLPTIRSGLSKKEDSGRNWINQLKKIDNQKISEYCQKNVVNHIIETVSKLKVPKYDKGNEYIKFNASIKYRKDWYIDNSLEGTCNHTARGHIVNDLYRYLFATIFAELNKKSPKLRDFPKTLLPNHRNVKQENNLSKFADRFRVQLADFPAKTITSHISKDGHYYIHPDPSQCRSFTVREAARIQTFPDNYYFCGPRTSQYRQVGNAVPPLLSVQIAKIVYKIFQNR